MKFLSFSPEVTRLRRLARACRAGEVSRHDYRESRRALIEHLMCDASATFEDTVPRFDRDITQRREYSDAVDNGLPVTAGRWSVWWFLLIVFLVIALPVAAFADASIQPVAERDPNPLQSQRLAVEQIHWQVPPALRGDFDQQEVDQFLTQQLAQKKQANAPAAHGFTSTELEEVARLLSALGVHDDQTRLSLADVQDLQAVIGLQKQRRGVSVLQLEQIAQALQQKIRNAGFVLARAYVPAQTVAAQSVTLEVQLGQLADVVVAADATVHDAPIAQAGLDARFAHLLGKAVHRQAVESELNRLNRVPGLTAQGKFVPGQSVGETVLELNVAQARKFGGAVQLDNFGYEPSSETRLGLTGQWSNPTGRGDALSATAVVGLESADQRFGRVSYLAPVWSGRYEAVARLSMGDLQVDSGLSEVLDADLVAAEFGLTDTRHLTRSASSELYYGLGVQEVDYAAPQGADVDQQAWFAAAQWRGHQLWDDAQLSLRGGIGVHMGGLDSNQFDQDEEFYRLRADLAVWKVIGRPFQGLGYDRPAKALLSWRGQLTNTALPAPLRLAASGPQVNRGFAPGLGYDDGMSMHAQLQFDHAYGAWWLFIDSSYGEQLRAKDEWLHQTSLGAGVEASLGAWGNGELSTRFSVGVPVTRVSSLSDDDLGEEDDVQIFWSLRFTP